MNRSKNRAPLLTQGVIIDLPDVPADPLDESAVLERVGAVLREDTGVSLFVRGDEGATHGRVMQGFALLKRAGANQIVLVTEFPDVEPD